MSLSLMATPTVLLTTGFSLYLTIALLLLWVSRGLDWLDGEQVELGPLVRSLGLALIWPLWPLGKPMRKLRLTRKR